MLSRNLNIKYLCNPSYSSSVEGGWGAKLKKETIENVKTVAPREEFLKQELG